MGRKVPRCHPNYSSAIYYREVISQKYYKGYQPSDSSPAMRRKLKHIQQGIGRITYLPRFSPNTGSLNKHRKSYFPLTSFYYIIYHSGIIIYHNHKFFNCFLLYCFEIIGINSHIHCFFLFIAQCNKGFAFDYFFNISITAFSAMHCVDNKACVILIKHCKSKA